jgi:alkanesulfonate monooxygenase SsuD/methylene tetrahydromethanopterin reductase-like flavin-dependent oxidoreductase (luciferase family)
VKREIGSRRLLGPTSRFTLHGLRFTFYEALNKLINSLNYTKRSLSMHVGIGLPNTLAGVDRELMLEWAGRADQGPFSSLGVFDRMVYDGYEPLTTLAAAAAVTRRIRLATTILISPLRNTGVLAKSAATIDALSGGRLVLGLAVGARQEDYEAVKADYHSRGKLIAEQLATLRAYWEDEMIGPKTTRPGGPEILVGGSSDITFARVARYADGYIHGGGPPRAFAKAAEKARAAWSDAGRPGRPQLWAQGYYALGDEAMIQAGADYLRDYYAFTGPSAEKIAAGLLTTPQAINQFVRGYEDAGCDELVLYPTVPELNQLERLAEALT